MALLVTVLAALGAWWWRHRAGALGAENRNTIAVLPLQNINNDPSSDYLRFALADEIANVLTYNRALDVRPTMSTRKFSKGEVDPQEVGRQLHVAIVMAGHFLRQESQILVTVEAIDVSSNRLLWETNLSAPAQDLIGLQGQLASQMRQGLLPQLGGAGGFIEAGTKPKNQDAYDLYLRSLAISRDPDPNKSAITILEETVALDPTYAPAWQALGLRYYYDATYAGGGDSAFQRSNAAYERALSLDPNLIVAAGNLITNRVERGDLGKAYDAAKELAQRRPQSGTAHFVLSYVLRYAGVLDPSARECDMALALDPGNFEFRSCAWSFLEVGRPERALDFIRLDAGSEWAAFMVPQALLREGKMDSARAAIGKISNNAHYRRDLFEACMAPRPGDEIEAAARRDEPALLAEPDPETHYYHGSLLAYCGQMEPAVELIRSSIEKNYCASTALKSDPLLAKLRLTPAFGGLEASALECQNKFRTTIRQPLP
jgi:TolB-like protein/Tfp pilus assembly protein PilF